MSSRARIVVVGGPDSAKRQWSEEAGVVLEGFADWQIVDAADAIAAEDQALAGADAILLCGWEDAGLGYISEERQSRLPSLAFLGTTAHYRQAKFIDLEAAARRPIVICDTAPVNALWVAEYELALCLSSLRRIPFEHHVVGTGGWVDWGELEEEPDLLTGRSFGLVSFGAIHRRLAALLRPFDVEGKVFDPYVPDEEVVAAGLTKVDDLTLLAATSDILFVATPPTTETMGLIDAEVLAALPDGALVVLVSRMGVVDQDALVPELTSGRIGFATDVYAPEPPSVDHPLRTLSNVIHTPPPCGRDAGRTTRRFPRTVPRSRAVLRRRAASLPAAARSGCDQRSGIVRTAQQVGRVDTVATEIPPELGAVQVMGEGRR